MAKTTSQLYALKSGNAKAKINIFWLPAWGHSLYSWEHVEPPFDAVAINHLIDFPGFGGAPAAAKVLSTADYASMVLNYIAANTNRQSRNFIVGHGFGAQVALAVAARNKPDIKGIVAICAGGFIKKPGPIKRFFHRIAKWMGKIVYKISPRIHEFFVKLLASKDYIKSQRMRKTYLKVMSEDLSLVAEKIAVPTYLIYGSNDYLNPSSIGVQYHTLIKNSTLTILPNLNHDTMLIDGSSRVAKLIASAIDEQG